MAKKDKSTFTDLELDAYNSWQEWPILLVKELKRLQNIQNRLDGIDPAAAGAETAPALEAPDNNAAVTQQVAAVQPAAVAAATGAAAAGAATPPPAEVEEYIDLDYDDDIWFDDPVLPETTNTETVGATAVPPSLNLGFEGPPPSASAGLAATGEGNTGEETSDEDDFEYFEYEY